MLKLRMQRALPVFLLLSGFMILTAGLSRTDARPNPRGPAEPQAQANSVSIDPTDIGGVVTSSTGPEAGVWVIAETNDLPTKYRKIVVTDDQGRYVIPDLPKAEYKVWVRGYGLVDGPTVSQVRPGQHLALTAVIAPNPKAAAQYYPANYWFSLMQVPAKSEFPMTVNVPASAGAMGGDTAAKTHVLNTQADWVASIKNCNGLCHQMGTKATREISPILDAYDTTPEKWNQRIRMGQLGGTHLSAINSLGHRRHLGRPVSSATSWSRSGTSVRPPRSCMTCIRPTSATRP
jgi:hypothetical protein